MAPAGTRSRQYIVGGSLSNQSAYDIRVGATDYFSTVYAYSVISTADTILSIRNNGLGMAIANVGSKQVRGRLACVP